MVFPGVAVVVVPALASAAVATSKVAEAVKEVAPPAVAATAPDCKAPSSAPASSEVTVIINPVEAVVLSVEAVVYPIL